MTMVLKIAHRDHVALADESEHVGPVFWRHKWVADVESVEILSSGFYRCREDVLEVHGTGVAVHASLGDSDAGRDTFHPLAMKLLLVNIAGKSDAELMLVSTAWLLGQNGDTIERIAP